MNDQFINDLGQNLANLKDNNQVQVRAFSHIQQYIPDKYPPDIDFAKNHGKAKRVAKPIEKFEQDVNQSQATSSIIDVCECCGLPIENELLPLCSDRIDLSDFGSGYPLYFEFVFYCIIMLVIMLLSFGIYAMASNANTNNIDDEALNHIIIPNNSIYNEINRLSIPNKLLRPDLYYKQTWVNFGAIVLIMISLHIFRRVQKLTERECDRGLVSPSDYTIMISKLPPGKYTEKDIERLIIEKIPMASNSNDRIVIKKVVLAYNISDFVANCRKCGCIELKVRKVKEYQKKNNGKLPEKVNLEALEEEVVKIKEQINSIKKEAEKEMNKRTCGDVFVTFSTQGNAQEIVERYEFSSLKKYYNYIKRFLCCDTAINENKLHYQDILLYVKRAPEPNDVIWENLGFSNAFRFKRRVFTNIATLLVLVVCFIIIFLISYYQSYVAESYQKNPLSADEGTKSWVRILGYISSFLIVFINTCLLLSIRSFANLEKHTTITHLDISVAEKLSIAQFCNTALITFLANYWIYHVSGSSTNNELFKEGGLVTDLFSIFLSNAFIPIVMTYFNPWYGFRLYKRWKLERQGENSFTTQAEANEIYEGGPLDMAYKYGILVKTMWLTSFYSCIMPIGILFSLCNLIFTYLLDKYLFLRRYARTPLLSADLNRSMIESLEYCPFLMASGSVFFHWILYNPETSMMTADFIALGLTCINFIFPAAEFNELFCKIEDETADKTPYDEAMRKFVTDYDRANPVTQEKAMNEWMSLVQGEPVGNVIEEKKPNIDVVQKYAQGNYGMYNNVMQKMIIKNNMERRMSGVDMKAYELKDTSNMVNTQQIPQQDISYAPPSNYTLPQLQQPGIFPQNNFFGQGPLAYIPQQQMPMGQNYYDNNNNNQI